MNLQKKKLSKNKIYNSGKRKSVQGIMVRNKTNSYQREIKYIKEESYLIGGLELAPKIDMRSSFIYDPNEKARFVDYLNHFLWRILGTGAKLFGWWLPDAAPQYLHYLDGTGTTKVIDYSKAYNEDIVIKKYIDEKIERMRRFANEAYINLAGNSFEIIGGLQKIPNGVKENWQKTIGAHFVYGHGIINVRDGIAHMQVTIYMEDMYNFHHGRKDIVTGAIDDINGRFVTLGWAKEFKTIGSLVLTVSWNVN